MAQVGKYNTLRVVKLVEFGLYLDGGDLGEILLPRRYEPKNVKPDDTLDIFLYYDSEDRIIATTEKPYAQAGDFCYLKVTGVSKHGAFLDWGLMKDLFVPFREQITPMQEGRSYVVYIYTDGVNGRLLASSKIDRFFNKKPEGVEKAHKVDALIIGKSDLGYKCVVNNKYSGLLYNDQIFQELKPGQKLKVFVNKVREDGRLDLLLQKPGYGKVTDLKDQVVETIKAHGNFLSLTDKSSAEEIYRLFGVSKRTFKQTIGNLYKERLITIEENGIRLMQD